MEQPTPIGEKPNYHYFLDGKRVDNPSSSLTGAEIRAKLPPDQKNYAIYLETEGDDPDKLISDSETFSLEKHIPHFFTVPPANFGSV
jgi:multiubiquitin